MSCDIRSCLFGVILIFLSLVVERADAQTKSPPPAGMTQQQYDELVKSVGESVLQTLTEKGLVAKPSASPLAAQPIEVDEEALVAEQIGEAIGAIPKVAESPAATCDQRRKSPAWQEAGLSLRRNTPVMSAITIAAQANGS
jgi:hypothetical protein